MTFHLVIVSMISEYQNDFYGYLKNNAYKNAFSLLFHGIRFNRSLKWQNVNQEKYRRGKKMNFFKGTLSFFYIEMFSPTKLPPKRYFRVAQTIKNQSNFLSLYSSRTCYIQDFLRNSFRKKEKKANIKEISFYSFVKKQLH